MPDERVEPLERLVGRARLFIAFERFWPPLVLGLAVVATFVACSWLGLWIALPRWAHLAGLAGFAAALVAAAALAGRVKRPSRADALARLDRDSGHRHRPVSSSQDLLANADADPATRALWDLHRRRLAAAVASVRVALPAPRLVERDRFALRAGVLLGLVASAFVAGVDKEGRLAAALDLRQASTAAAAFRIDAWIDPPAYTGRPPVLLPVAADDVAVAKGSRQASAPVNSTVVVRWAGDGKVEAAPEGGLKAAAPQPVVSGNKDTHPQRQASGETRLTLGADGRLAVRRDGALVSTFDVHAIPDLAPTVVLTEAPRPNLRGSLTLSYKIDDDYGVVAAEAGFANPVLHGKPVVGRSLVPPPVAPLVLPNSGRGLGSGQTTADLSDHPWAGAEVTMVLSAKDEGGNVGRSAPTGVTLPARPFHQPLARALVEQRRDLILDPDHHDRVDTALSALMVAPELFGTTPSIFLGLNAARTRLQTARTDADLLNVGDLLWSMALAIEEGDLSQTEHDLRALQKQLRDAVARGAPPEELKKLAEELKQQLQKFLNEMAGKNRDGGDKSRSARDSKTVTPQDLQSLLDRMERSAENGDLAQAQQLLDELQNILENLRSAQSSPSEDGASEEMKQSMGALDRMMRDQQDLRDNTFKRGNQRHQAKRNRHPEAGQDQDQSGAQPQDDPSEEGDDQDQAQDGSSDQDLQNSQQALREQLEQLQKQMRELGLEGEKGLDEAQQAMKDAERELGKGGGGTDRAVEAQGRALQGLQKGARGLQNQMAQGEGGQQGQRGIGRADGTGERDGTDPLGRQRGSRDKGMDAQGEFNPGEGLAQRAQKVLEELRRRLGDRLRPQEEQDYLERLLKRY